MDTKTKPAGEKSGDAVRAVGRALDILMAFRAGDRELSASELAGRVGLTLPTLYRLLYTLEHNGFVMSVGEPQRFRLGPAVAHLTHVWSAGFNLRSVAAPILREIWEQTEETVSLFVRQGDDRICIAELPSPHALSFKRGIGRREPLLHGASSHAMLAHIDMSRDQLAAYLQDADVGLEPYLAELEAVRRQGYAVSHAEVLKGAVSIAAPFFSGPGVVGGAIVVFGPASRLREPQIQACAKLLVQKAALLSTLLFAG
ncbi:MAG: IclR family transcriptional regulator [Pigmentiphaga sp.]|uniref:IclR family transcriptional regulator n=1 Tax=Pigmentiphaga sp. TaxID=1977564 RepID=UPI0029B8A306|nr:IclR family transcriptional regulator [Pigmentiphaga sp.]MDX3907183.1 IclR family transcriptional regulator [Pigmentiphaga sp.]